MNAVRYFLFCCIIFSFSSTTVYAVDTNSKNLGFESGTFTGWTGYNWLFSTKSPSINTSVVQVTLPTSRRQVIMTDTTAYDANTGNALKIIPNGYRYSARLGDMINGDASPRGWEQSLRYTMKIDSTNALLVMKFACVLQYSSSHDNITEMEPRFRLKLVDQLGDTISDCANYEVYASSGNVKGFQTYTPSGPNASRVRWRDWTTVGANLMDYMGQTITIEFMTADCTGNYHYGYAYFVAESHPMYITVKYCSGDTNATLTAPEGFETYSWVNDNGVIVDSAQSLVVESPVEGATYSCQMTSATGCSLTLTSTIAKYEPNADFKYDLVDCDSLTNTMRFTNLHPATHGTLEYMWHFGDGTSSTEKSPAHTYTTSGMHQVSLVVSNPPSLCTDSVSKSVETFYPPLVGINGDATYCPGTSVTLKAHGAYRYMWNDGSQADSITVSDDTTIWMIGYSSMGCHTGAIKYKVSQAPDWNFMTDGNTLYCNGSSTVLNASGAKKYHWSTGETTNSITVNKVGTYTVVGENARGCEKSVSFSVLESPLPNVDFTLSRETVDSRHAELTCSVPDQSGVQYSWDMGDDVTEIGSAVQHTYAISNALLEYKISLTATNATGCVNSISKTVDIVPFIPNVFTPNGDGVNEVFVPNLELQVFDRYGIQLYKGTDGWDGKYKGKRVDNDSYFYLIHFTDKNQQVQTRKGYVTLKR